MELTRSVDAGAFEGRVQRCSTGDLDTARPGVRRIFLLGDSHAISLLPLARRFHQLGFAITMLARQGCTLADMRKLLWDADHLAEGAMDRLEQPLLGLLGEEGRLSRRHRPPPQGPRP